MPELQWRIFQANLDLVRGSEQAGSRPVLVVSRESIHRSLPVVGICPLTSLKPGRKVYPTEIFLPAGQAGLTLDSLVMAHQVRTVAKERLGKALGLLSDQSLRRTVREALRLFLAFDQVD